MGRGPKWTDAEEARLRELFADGRTDLQIAALMRRTPSAVADRRGRMGLLRTPSHSEGARSRRWLVVGGIGFEVEEGPWARARV